jgi:hypothetical protein
VAKQWRSVWGWTFFWKPVAGRFYGRRTRRFRIDGLITAVVAVAREQPLAGFSPQPVPMGPQFDEQLWAEHDVAIRAPLTALDVNHHSLAVDVADFQACQLCVADSGGIQRHQYGAIASCRSGVDELRDFFLAENRREATCLFRIGSFSDAPGLPESLDVEKAQSCEAYRDGTRRQLPLLKQLGLMLTNVPRTQAVRPAVESSGKIFDCADVVACGMLRVITALEFLQHHFA